MLKHSFSSHCNTECTLYIIYSSCVLVAVSKTNFHVSHMLSTLSRYNVTFTLIWVCLFNDITYNCQACIISVRTYYIFSLERCLEAKALQNYSLLKWENDVQLKWVGTVILPDQCDISAVHDGKVGCNTSEYTVAFLHSDWLYFLWHVIN